MNVLGLQDLILTLTVDRVDIEEWVCPVRQFLDDNRETVDVSLLCPVERSLDPEAEYFRRRPQEVAKITRIVLGLPVLPITK